jgi:hypothetical protein
LVKEFGSRLVVTAAVLEVAIVVENVHHLDSNLGKTSAG